MCAQQQRTVTNRAIIINKTNASPIMRDRVTYRTPDVTLRLTNHAWRNDVSHRWRCERLTTCITRGERRVIAACRWNVQQANRPRCFYHFQPQLAWTSFAWFIQQFYATTYENNEQTYLQTDGTYPPLPLTSPVRVKSGSSTALV